jgi:hypothetical protein
MKRSVQGKVDFGLTLKKEDWKREMEECPLMTYHNANGI